MLNPTITQAIIVCATIAMVPQVASADCDCEHVLELDQLTFDGSEVSPGDSVCIRAGQRESLRLSNFQGTEAKPITVRNCDGIAIIENDNRGYGITVNRSEHLRITGTGDGEELGFFVRASKDGPDYSAMGVAIGGYSHHLIVDHLEVVDAGFAAFIVKTDPSCEDRDLRDHVQRDIELHHNTIRSPNGEGFYLGNTGYPSRTINCDGQPTEVFPHRHEGLRVHHNRIEDSGWDGLQVSVTPKDCHIYSNIVVNPATRNTEYQDKGLVFGGNTSCAVYANILQGGPDIGIVVIGSDDMTIYNNVITDFAADGIYVNLENSDPSTHEVSIAHNTVIRSGANGIRVFGRDLLLQVQNNLIIESAEEAIALGNTVASTELGNLVDGIVSEQGFVGAMAGDYRLERESRAVDVGTISEEAWATQDADGVGRDSQPDVGAFEYTDAPRPDPGIDPIPPTDKETQTGCGCSTEGRHSSGVLWLTVLLLILRRKRRIFPPTTATTNHETNLH